MSRYIDADAIDFSPLKNDFDRARAKVVIMGQPTADVVEVRHGHWITEKEALAIDRFDLAYTCSICGHLDWDCTESESFNYCPNCGARMDGERREENEG